MIIFEKIRYKNFLATGNHWTEISLNTHKTTLFVGKNSAGKSTICDAIVFALFGKAYRNINKPQLVNSINKKDCVVQLHFNIGESKYKIIRGLSPIVFEIYHNDVLIDQNSKSKDYQNFLEENILKLNSKIFNQIVMLGSANYVPFMELTAQARREIIESLLDIEIFGKMNTVLKEKMTDTTNKFMEYEKTLNVLDEKIRLQQSHIEKLKNLVRQDIDKKLKMIEALSAEIQDNENNKQLYCDGVTVLMAQISDFSLLQTRKTQFAGIQHTLFINNEKLIREIQFFDKHQSCPSCKQTITDDHKNSIIQEKNSKKLEIQDGIDKTKEEIQKIDERITRINEIQSEIQQLNLKISECNYNINTKQKSIKDIQADITKQENVESTDCHDKLKEFEDDSAKIKEARNVLIVDRDYQEKAQVLLKDTGIKTKIIKYYLPIINGLINKYLTMMNFCINYNLSENFTEEIKSNNRDNFTFASFSEGEKFRINISLLMTWREIAKLKNNINCNLLFLDEVFDSSLDHGGTEDFLKLIQTLDEKTNVFMISHKPDIGFDKFDRVIKMKKTKNFTRIDQ